MMSIKKQPQAISIHKKHGQQEKMQETGNKALGWQNFKSQKQVLNKLDNNNTHTYGTMPKYKKNSASRFVYVNENGFNGHKQLKI